jgi:hypothetical protein
MQANEHWESDEEFLARLAARRAKRKAEKAAAEEAAKSQLTLKVEPQMVEAVKADPRSVRLAARTNTATAGVIQRPEVMEVVEPLEVDGCTIRRAQITTWRMGEARPTVAVIDYQNGYRRGGVVSDYNPLDGLRRPEDE